MKPVKKSLEEVIASNRASFEDDFTFEQESWNQIKKHIPQQKKEMHSQFLWKAAAIALLLCTIGLLVERNYKNDELAYYEQYVQNQELVYLEMISDRKIQLSSYEQKLNSSLQDVFQTDLDKLDAIYEELKTDLQNGLQTDQLVDAMILNLQMRVELLDRQIEIIRSIKQVKNENHETQI